MTAIRDRLGAALRWAGAGALVVLSLTGVAMAFPDLVSRHVVPLFLYLPGRVPDAASTPAAAGLGHGRELRIETGDGVRLHAWWIPPRPGSTAPRPGGPRGDGASARGETEARARAPGSGPAAGSAPGCGAVVFFHGNAGTLVQRAGIAAALSRRGFGTLLVDYRGYGRSEGTPGEEGLYRDGRAAFRHAVRELGHRPGRVALAGHSLGSAVAARVAARHAPGAVVLTGTFPDMPELARHAYPYLPDPLFRGWTTNRFEVRRAVSRIDAPVLVARGGLDTLVPRALTRTVFEAAAEPKRWYEAPAAGHNDLWDHEGFLREATSFLADALGCAADGG